MQGNYNIIRTFKQKNKDENSVKRDPKRDKTSDKSTYRKVRKLKEKVDNTD